MPNHLENENSPYLLQHKDNPVDWYPWGETALKKAQEEQKPIFLSIGYAACHWCHVMAHESFENSTTAALLNHNFVAIKVDREERPDLDTIYMQAVQAMTGSGGWPMSVFLTPGGKPFWGGTYFPPVPRLNMPSFNQVLDGIAEAWRSDRQAILQSGESFTQKLYMESKTSSEQYAQTLNQENLQKAVIAMAEGYDWQYGGWGRAPKFPLPVRLLFLLQQAADGDEESLKIAEHALNAMAQGGMVDVVGGGFARYSTDVRWLVPHFEKMLYDNALLARAYLYAYLLTHDEEYRRICEETLRFVQREMTLPQGGFISSIDADSEGVEGKFYVWSDAEIDSVLSDPDDNLLLRTVYHISVQGNFEGHNILQRMRPLPEAAQRLGLRLEELHQRLDAVHQLLHTARAARVHPHLDDKVLVSWNAMMLQTFAEAARYFQKPGYLETAQKNADFLLTHLVADGRLLRSWREGSAHLNGFLEDHAALILALLELYQSDHDQRWYTSAKQLTDEMLTAFYEPKEGFYDTRRDHETLITRPQDLQDNATPSGSSQAVLALLRLAAFSGKSEYYDIAVQTIQQQSALITGYPSAFSNWLSAYALAMADGREIAILGDPQDKQTQTMLNIIWESYRPFQISAISGDPPAAESPELLQDRHSLGGVPTVYVCHHHACRAPVTSVEELLSLLAS